MTESESKRGETTTRSEGHEADEPASGFRVIDRRRFAPDGSEREEAEAATPPVPGAGSECAGKAAPPSGSHPSAAAAPDLGAAGGGAGSTSEFVMSDAPPRSDTLSEATLSTLVLSLSTQALMHLGEIPDVASGQAQRDLPAARSIIDLLAVLQRKTEGNLEAEEAALLDRILYDLRMRFVAISRA
jgi:hypothetical protein